MEVADSRLHTLTHVHTNVRTQLWFISINSRITQRLLFVSPLIMRLSVTNDVWRDKQILAIAPKNKSKDENAATENKSWSWGKREQRKLKQTKSSNPCQVHSLRFVTKKKQQFVCISSWYSEKGWFTLSEPPTDTKVNYIILGSLTWQNPLFKEIRCRVASSGDSISRA